ncbi:MAG: hypothetical protein ACHQ2Y_00130 [Candidatus Lutacidiplasmatales archaeon]
MKFNWARSLRLTLATTGAVLLLLTLSLGWWTITTDSNPLTLPGGHDYHFQATASYLPGSSFRFWCSVNDSSAPGWGTICPGTQPIGELNPYNDPISGSTHVGALYNNLEVAVWLMGLIGLAGAIMLGLRGLISPGRLRTALGIGWVVLVVAAILAFAVPLGVLMAQTTAYSQDHPGDSRSVGTFWGSCQSTGDPTECGYNTTETWGAGPAWYLSFLAGGLLLTAACTERASIRRGNPASSPKSHGD